jgi:hypothetical protein
MTSLLRAAAVTMAALALVVTAGCGGGGGTSSNDYAKAINKVQTDFAANIQNVGKSVPSSGSALDQAQQTFTKLDAAIAKAVSDLKAVTPPDKVKSLHNDLISEMTEFEADVKTAADSLKSKDPTKLTSAQSKFASSAGTLGTRISATISQINQKLH